MLFLEWACYPVFKVKTYSKFYIEVRNSWFPKYRIICGNARKTFNQNMKFPLLHWNFEKNPTYSLYVCIVGRISGTCAVLYNSNKPNFSWQDGYVMFERNYLVVKIYLLTFCYHCSVYLAGIELVLKMIHHLYLHIKEHKLFLLVLTINAFQ